MNCTVCNNNGHYMISRDPDETDLCSCPAGDSLRTPGERALQLLMRAFNQERTP